MKRLTTLLALLVVSCAGPAKHHTFDVRPAAGGAGDWPADGAVGVVSFLFDVRVGSVSEQVGVTVPDRHGFIARAGATLIVGTFRRYGYDWLLDWRLVCGEPAVATASGVTEVGARDCLLVSLPVLDDVVVRVRRSSSMGAHPTTTWPDPTPWPDVRPKMSTVEIAIRGGKKDRRVRYESVSDARVFLGRDVRWVRDFELVHVGCAVPIRTSLRAGLELHVAGDRDRPRVVWTLGLLDRIDVFRSVPPAFGELEFGLPKGIVRRGTAPLQPETVTSRDLGEIDGGRLTLDVRWTPAR